MSAILQAEKRLDLRRSHLRQLRNQGYVPGILYGDTADNTPVQVLYTDFIKVLRAQGMNSVVHLDVQGEGKQTVLIHDYQVDPLKDTLLHIDFKQVSMKEKVDTSVGIELQGEPAGVKEGGILQQNLREIEIRCLPGDIPSTITLDISSLAIGDSLTVSDLPLPEGVEFLTDETESVVSVLPPEKSEEQEENEAENDGEPAGEENGE